MLFDEEIARHHADAGTCQDTREEKRGGIKIAVAKNIVRVGFVADFLQLLRKRPNLTVSDPDHENSRASRQKSLIDGLNPASSFSCAVLFSPLL